MRLRALSVSFAALCCGCAAPPEEDLSSSTSELFGLLGPDVPNNQPRLFRMAAGGGATAIDASSVRGARAAVIVHGFTVDVRAMVAVSDYLLGHRELYDDVLVFQYDTYHTAPSQSARLLQERLERLPSAVRRVDFYTY